MTQQTRQAAMTHDPIARRFIMAAIWIGLYALLWTFYWRPVSQVAWVNGAIVAAILIGTLPPARIRNFTASAGYLGVAVIMQLTFKQSLAAIVLTALGCIAVYNGVEYLKQRRR